MYILVDHPSCSSWVTDDLDAWPKLQNFREPSFHKEIRTFKGWIDYLEHPVQGGVMRMNYEIVFNSDFTSIESGTIIKLKVDGTYAPPRNLKELNYSIKDDSTKVVKSIDKSESPVLSSSSCETFDFVKGRGVEADSDDPSGKTVISTSSSKGHCLIPTPLESGQGSWEFELVNDELDNEYSCVGACNELEPEESSYEDSPSMYMYRAYNGVTYNKGSSGNTLTKFHKGDKVKVIADLDAGTMNYEVNGVLQVAFEGVVGPLYPCVCFYGSGKKVKLNSLQMSFKGSIHLSHFYLKEVVTSKEMIAKAESILKSPGFNFNALTAGEASAISMAIELECPIMREFLLKKKCSISNRVRGTKLSGPDNIYDSPISLRFDSVHEKIEGQTWPSLIFHRIDKITSNWESLHFEVVGSCTGSEGKAKISLMNSRTKDVLILHPLSSKLSTGSLTLFEAEHKNPSEEIRSFVRNIQENDSIYVALFCRKFYIIIWILKIYIFLHVITINSSMGWLCCLC